MFRSRQSIAFGCVALILSVISWIVVMQGAVDEPYFEYRHADAFTQIAVGSALLTVWACFAVAVLVLIGLRQLSMRWFAGVVWAAICMFYLSCCPLGYLNDLEQNILPRHGVAIVNGK